LAGRFYQRRWSWLIEAGAEDLWRILADTERFNEAAGLPIYKVTETPRGDGGMHYRGAARMGIIVLRWREVPVNWVAPRWLEHIRLFETGPLASLTARLLFEPEGAATRFSVEVEAAARNFFGEVLLRSGFFPATERMYHRQAQAADAFLRGAGDEPFSYVAPQPASSAKAKADAIAGRIEASGHGHGHAAELVAHLFRAQEVELQHMRPLRFARDRGLNPRQTVELFLQATKDGLLQMRWDLLCPRCRISKAAVSALDDLPKGAHCGTCNIDYDADFSRNVELAFSPAPAVRDVAAGAYCLFGPGSTPHIRLQVAVGAGQTREEAADLAPGRYRLRTLEPGPELEIDHEVGPFPSIRLEDRAVAAGPLPEAGRVRIENRSARDLVAIIEDRPWVRDALTADRVTSLQAFRDLFSDQVLRPGDEVSVRRIALLFTDLRGSTALYNAIGDSAAYHLVREHFAFLAGIVRDHNGALVKTIGDAVMASFTDPADALSAGLAIQESVDAFNGEQPGEAIVLKLGLHEGPAIAVTLNGRLDYFGATTNLAARLQGESQGGDIVISESMAADPGVVARIEGMAQRREAAKLKGCEDPVAFIRLGRIAP
jgi:class 3 adenylate cyclase